MFLIPEDLLVFYLVTPEMKNQHSNLSDAPAVTRSGRAHSLGDGGIFVMDKMNEGNTDFVTPIIRGSWLLAQLAILILKVLSLTRPRVQMSSQIQLFSASDFDKGWSRHF